MFGAGSWKDVNARAFVPVQSALEFLAPLSQFRLDGLESI
jgi:hypothetical protein